ncbi:MAG: flagellar basal body P-ring formation chaperone FlgA [Litorimonas sp.]
MRAVFLALAALTLLAAPSALAADVTTTRALQRGMVLDADDLSGDYHEDDFIGMELVRSVRAGAPLTVRNVRAPRLVKRNETVTLVFRRGPLVMETIGRSLGEGGLGERVSVMNTSSRQRVMGRITAEGTVEVSP